jgi:diguanylate cyclase (GGDEF)-like protein
MHQSFLPVQLIAVALLASLGLLTLGRWARTTGYRLGSWAWLVFAAAATFLLVAPLLPGFTVILLTLHLLGSAAFAGLLVWSVFQMIHLDEVRQVRLRQSAWLVLSVLACLSLAVVVSRWPPARRWTQIWDERHFWSGPWIIAAALATVRVIQAQGSSWRNRPACLLTIFSMLCWALDEACCLGVLLWVQADPPTQTAARLLEFLQDLTPILAGFVALAMHTLVLEGLALHLEQSLVRVSKRSAQLKLMAERDPLTAVMNRHAFYSLVGAKREGIPTPLGGSVAVLDIDDLKPLNDQYGHQAGDAAIRAVAKAIRSVVRAEDLLFRWGGDEFLVILPHVILEEARWRFSKLDDLLCKTSLPGASRPVSITLSAGVAPFSSAVSLEQAIEEADERMYAHKATKKTAPSRGQM